MLPQMNDAFRRFLAPAQVNKSLWMLVLGIVLIVLFQTEFLYAILALIALVRVDGGGSFGQAWNSVLVAISTPDTPANVLILLSTFIGMMGAVCLTAFILRDRSPRTLIGQGPVLRNMAIAAGIFFMLLAVSSLVLHLVFNPSPNLPLSSWLIWMPAALPLLFIQITAEEMIFRGFLQQELAVRFKSRWVWMVLPSVLFGALHFEAEKYGSNAWLIVISTGIFGLLAADVTARTGNLGAAIGLHFVNNFFAMMVTSLDGTITGLSLFVTPFGASDTETLRALMIVDIGFAIFAYISYLMVIHLKRSR